MKGWMKVLIKLEDETNLPESPVLDKIKKEDREYDHQQLWNIMEIIRDRTKCKWTKEIAESMLNHVHKPKGEIYK